MDATKVKTLRNVFIEGEFIRIGAVLTLPHALALELIHTNKAVIVKPTKTKKKGK